MSDEEVSIDEVEEPASEPTPKPKKAKAASKASKTSKAPVEETTQVFYGVDPMYQNTSIVKRAKRPE